MSSLLYMTQRKRMERGEGSPERNKIRSGMQGEEQEASRERIHRIVGGGEERRRGGKGCTLTGMEPGVRRRFTGLYYLQGQAPKLLELTTNIFHSP